MISRRMLERAALCFPLLLGSSLNACLLTEHSLDSNGEGESGALATDGTLPLVADGPMLATGGYGPFDTEGTMPATGGNGPFDTEGTMPATGGTGPFDTEGTMPATGGSGGTTSCVYAGQEYADGSTFPQPDTDGCNTCSCVDGRVDCVVALCDAGVAVTALYTSLLLYNGTSDRVHVMAAERHSLAAANWAPTCSEPAVEPQQGLSIPYWEVQGYTPGYQVEVYWWHCDGDTPGEPSSLVVATPIS